MPLEDKLRELKLKEERQERAKQAKAEEKRKKKEKPKQQEEKEKKRAEKFVQEKLSPIVEVVNKAYLDGEGEIIVADADIMLSWDERSSGGAYSGSKSGKMLSSAIDKKAMLVGCGQDAKGKPSKTVAKIRMADSKWQAKLEDAICKGLSSGSCSWEKLWGSVRE